MEKWAPRSEADIKCRKGQLMGEKIYEDDDCSGEILCEEYYASKAAFDISSPDFGTEVVIQANQPARILYLLYYKSNHICASMHLHPVLPDYVRQRNQM